MDIKPVTLVLGGVGIKGVASIGILQALHDHDIKVKKIYAAGASALVAGYYAMGKDPSDLKELFVQFFTGNHKALWGLEQISGLFQTQRRRIVDSFGYFLRERLYCRANMTRISLLGWEVVDSLISGVYGDTTFYSLKIPVSISTVDLNAKRLFLIEEGRLSEAMKAGIAFPGLFPPADFGGRRLVSSTLCCELPLDTIRHSDSPVITVDFPTLITRKPPRSLLEIISRTTEIRSNVIKTRLLEKVDYVVRLESINRYRWGNYHQIPDMILHTRQETYSQLALIQDFKRRFKSGSLVKGGSDAPT